MKSPRATRWLLAAILIVSPPCLLGQTPTEPGATGATIWGDPVGGLQMSLYLDPQQTGTSHAPAIRIGLRNVGSSEIAVILGGSCGNRKIEPNSVKLILTDDQGKSQRLDDIGPEPIDGGCLGAMGIWKVPLSPGASFSIPINLDYFRYFSKVTSRFETGRQPGGTYSLEADLLTGANTNQSIDVKSNVLRVHFRAE
jgi:hypothetical protein